jgi:hypothetical protein
MGRTGGLTVVAPGPPEAPAHEARYGVFVHDPTGWRALAFVPRHVAAATVAGATCRMVAMAELHGTWSVVYASHPALDGGCTPD